MNGETPWRSRSLSNANAGNNIGLGRRQLLIADFDSGSTNGVSGFWPAYMLITCYMAARPFAPHLILRYIWLSICSWPITRLHFIPSYNLIVTKTLSAPCHAVCASAVLLLHTSTASWHFKQFCVNISLSWKNMRTPTETPPKIKFAVGHAGIEKCLCSLSVRVTHLLPIPSHFAHSIAWIFGHTAEPTINTIFHSYNYDTRNNFWH